MSCVMESVAAGGDQPRARWQLGPDRGHRPADSEDGHHHHRRRHQPGSSHLQAPQVQHQVRHQDRSRTRQPQVPR